MTTINTLNKTDARAACKKAGIVGYGNMTVAQTRDALSEKRYFPEQHDRPSEPAVAGGLVEEPAVDAVVTTLPEPAPVEPAAPAAEPAKPKKVAAPKDQRNGITRPRAGKCLDVWTTLDSMKGRGVEITFEVLRAAIPTDIADATIRTQRQRWKQYNA